MSQDHAVAALLQDQLLEQNPWGCRNGSRCACSAAATIDAPGGGTGAVAVAIGVQAQAVMTAARRQLTRRLNHLHLNGIQLDFCSSAPRASATSSSRPAVSSSVRLHMMGSG